MEKELNILQRLLKVIGYYTLKARWRQKRTIDRWAREDAARRDVCRKEILSINKRILPLTENNKYLTVSLTSHGKRVANFAPFAIYSILQQTRLPNRIVLNIDKTQWSEVNLPDLIKKLQVAGLEVNYCEDVGPHTKLLPTLKKYPDDVIITVDDDIVYDGNMIECLMREYEQSNKRTVICHEARTISRDAEGKLLLYSQWRSEKDTQLKSATVGSLSPYGYRGVLYPPHVFSKEIFNKEVYRKLCPYADDIWFTVMELLNDIAVKSIEHMHSKYCDIDRENEYTSSGSDALHFLNAAQGKNDEQLAALIEYYKL